MGTEQDLPGCCGAAFGHPLPEGDWVGVFRRAFRFVVATLNPPWMAPVEARPL